MAASPFDLATGKSARLFAKAIDQKGSTDPTSIVTWSSNDPTIATVDSTGLVRGMSVGMVVITATCGTATNTTQVTVYDPVITTISITVPN